MYKKFTWKERIEVLLMGDLTFTMNNDLVREERPPEENPTIGLFSIETLMGQVKMRDEKIAQLEHNIEQKNNLLEKLTQAKLMLADIYNEYTLYLITRKRVPNHEQPIESTFLPQLIDKAGVFTNQKKSAPPAKED